MNNINLATEIQFKIFPRECGYYHYLDSLENVCEYNNYYIVYDEENNAIGVTGTYVESIDEDSIWLGWFGVLEKYRSKGYGTQILKDTIDICKSYNKFKYFRLYTSDKSDYTARPLYKKIMQMQEYYNNKNDSNYDNSCIIYSYSLTGDEIQKWDSKFLGIDNIIKQEQNGIEFYNKNIKEQLLNNN